MYFENINLLRAFAALSVMVYHVIELYPWKDFPIQGPLLWFRIGWLGVDLFFVISGFVITLTASQLLDQQGSSFYKIYLRRRIARIAPLYLLTGFFFIVFTEPTLLKDSNLYKNIFYHLFFIHNTDFATHSALNGPNWSIGVEMQFYLLIMISIRYLVRWHPGLILLVCILISWMWRIGAFLLFCSSVTCDIGRTFMFSTQIFGCLDEFGFGIFLCRLILDKNHSFFHSNSLYNKPWFWLVAIVIVAWLALSIYWSWSTYWEYWWMVTFWKTLSGAAFFILLVIAIQTISLIHWNKIIFGPLWYLGEISYGIYLWHILVIRSLNQAKIFNTLEFLLLTTVFTITLAVFSWHFFEKPLIKKFH